MSIQIHHTEDKLQMPGACRVAKDICIKYLLNDMMCMLSLSISLGVVSGTMQKICTNGINTAKTKT